MSNKDFWENDINTMEFIQDDLKLSNDYQWPTAWHLLKLVKFIKKEGLFNDYNFWLTGAFPTKLFIRDVLTFDIDITFVNKNRIHDNQKIKEILKNLTIYSHNVLNICLDISYAPNADEEEQQMDMGEDAWGKDKSKWPTKKNIEKYCRIKLKDRWYIYKDIFMNGKKQEFPFIVEYKEIIPGLWSKLNKYPSEKQVLRTIQGHEYHKPFLINECKEAS
mgnify:CR=1 FL=1